MTEHGVLPDLIERFLVEPVAAPVLPDLRAAGAAAARRRRRRDLGVGAAALVLVVGGVAVGQELLGGSGDRTDDPVSPTDTIVEPPPGTRWAGIGRVVVAVPEGWKDRQDLPCAPTVPAVYFPSDQVRHCMLIAPASSLMLSDRPLTGPGEPPGDLDSQVDGHDVLVANDGCDLSLPETCSMDVTIPDLDAYFRITVHATGAEAIVQEIRDSLTVLPEGQAAIPLVESWNRSDVEDAYAAMESLGLEPTIEEGCNDAGLCDLSAWTDPPAGRVVSTGTPVTIYVVGWGDGPDPFPLNVLTCDNDYQRADGIYDVIAPSSPKEAREQGWPTDPLAAVEGVPDAPAWRHLGIVDLTLLDPFDDGLARVSAQDAEGRTVLIMRVEELVKDAWAMTGSETCG